MIDRYVSWSVYFLLISSRTTYSHSSFTRLSTVVHCQSTSTCSALRSLYLRETSSFNMAKPSMQQLRHCRLCVARSTDTSHPVAGVRHSGVAVDSQTGYPVAGKSALALGSRR